jgi:hypothetical protein
VQTVTFKCQFAKPGDFKRELKIKTSLQAEPVSVTIEGSARIRHKEGEASRSKSRSRSKGRRSDCLPFPSRGLLLCLHFPRLY